MLTPNAASGCSDDAAGFRLDRLDQGLLTHLRDVRLPRFLGPNALLLAERARSGDESVSSDNFERATFSTAGSYSDLAECVADADAWKELVYADRLAFSALQAMPASSREDANELTKCRSYALGLVHGCQGLEERLAIAASLVETQLQTLRAKVALMTLDVVD